MAACCEVCGNDDATGLKAGGVVKGDDIRGCGNEFGNASWSSGEGGVEPTEVIQSIVGSLAEVDAVVCWSLC